MITYAASDTAGNTATATQTVTVVDTTAPILSVPTSITTEATASQTSVTLGTATATDIFGATVTNDAPATFPVGVTTVTYTATDGNGLTSTGTQTVTVTDTVAPTITVPANITVEATAALTTVNLGVASAADLVDGVVSVANDAPVSFPVGTTTVTYTATDTAGNIATATQTVTVTDTTPPVLSLIGATAITVEAGSVYTDSGATAVDLVDGDISSLISVTGTVDTNILGSYTLTYQVSDASGNAAVSLSRTITVVDTTPPAITAPAAVSATSGDNLPVAANIGIATATDLFAVTITYDAPATFPVGTTVVTWTATDANGNAATATQLVTVTLVDITPPTVTAPANITLEATSALTTVNLGIASATDIVDGTLPVTSNAPTAFPVGTTIVIYSATDAAGNTGTATQTVTITDTTAPSLTPPIDLVVEATSIVFTPVFNLGVATVTDLVDTGLIATHNAPALFPFGTTPVVWSVADSSGNTATATQLVTIVDTTPPSITAPAAIQATSNDNQPVPLALGTPAATDLFAVTITNDAPATYPVGTTTVTWTATDANGNTATATQSVTVTFVDIAPPVITPPINITLEATAVLTSVNLGIATATDNVDASVVISNDAPATFSVGITTVTYSATDAAGNTASATQTITITDTTPPIVSAPLDVNLTSTDGNPVIDVIGTASATDLVDGTVTVTNDAPNAFPVGITTVTYTATDAAGNSATATQVVTVTYTPPLPPVSQAAASISDGSFGALYRSLVPADATIAAYDDKRFSIITGIVNDLNGNPISGVKAMIHNHPEYGSSLTDATGRYSLPVDGGALLTVDMTHANYLMVQRQVKTEWNQIYTAETVALIAQDTKATVVTFNGDPYTKIVHSSTPVTDVDGTRATHLVFSGDTVTTVKHADGSITPLNGPITVRATEFIRPDTMPGDLPPTSAFTYCADIRIDGTLPTDSVQFSKPVVMYVDNFLGFPVGEVVPVGYFDRVKALWVSSDNGVVVQLLDVNNDSIVDALDSTGDGLPNDLNANGSFADEVAGIIGDPVYAVGNSYWRAEHTHFTPTDYNWPWYFPSDAKDPPSTPPFIEDEKNCADEGHECTGSEVSRESRVFSEDVKVAGADFNLHYKSSQTNGYKQIISIPVSGASIPASTLGIEVSISVAGRQFDYNLSLAPNQDLRFIWDGLDIYGNKVAGNLVANVLVSYKYPAIYIPARRDRVGRAFAYPGVPGIVIGSRISAGAKKVRNYKIKFVSQSGLTADSIGSWSISNHHQLKIGKVFRGDGLLPKLIPYNTIITVAGGGASTSDGVPATDARIDPRDIAIGPDGSLYIADYRNSLIRKVDSNGIISTVAGTGISGFSGDGGLATSAQIGHPTGIYAGNDGSIYFVDSANFRVRKISPDGVISTVAGNGTYGCTSGNGGLARLAPLCMSYGDVIVAPDGSIYILEVTGNSSMRVRKVGTDGMISLYAGKINSDKYGISTSDGTLATNAGFSGYAYGMGLGLDGSLYIPSSEAQYGRGLPVGLVRKVLQDGTTSTVAGGSTGWVLSDGIPAVGAYLDQPFNITFSPFGSMYILDSKHNEIYVVSSSGIINKFGGVPYVPSYGSAPRFSGDGGYVSEAEFFRPKGIATDPVGNLYIADTGNGRVRKVLVSEAVTSFDTTVQNVADQERGELLVFSQQGKHLKTKDLKTGSIIRTFGYDIDGSLSSITDRFGNVTQILNSGGVPYAIVAPDGQTTDLNIVNGQLTDVTYPDGSGYAFTYTPDGLLTGKKDPNGGQFVYTYDANGRVVQTKDAVGGVSQFTTSASKGVLYATTTDQEGRSYSSTRKNEFSGASIYTRTGKDGLTMTRKTSSDKVTESTAAPDGTVSMITYGIDPQYNTRRTNALLSTLPSGLASNQSSTIAYVDNNTDGKPDVITRKVTNNGLITTIVNNVLNGTRTITTPAGRTATVNYDVTNLLTTSSTTSGLASSSYAYDFRGRLISTTSGNANPRTTRT